MRAASVIFTTSLVGTALVAIGLGFAIIGSPEKIRVRRLDEQRVSELQSLNNAINNYRNEHHRLPDTLDEVAQSGGLLTMNHGPYEYHPTTSLTYQLCGEFSGDLKDYPRQAGQLDPWAHGAGHVCFIR